jgi:hypothetical protein
MEETGYFIRLAEPGDIELLKKSVKATLASPEGKGSKKKFEDAIARNELLILERRDPRLPEPKVEAFIEWYTRVDGSVTIRDAGSIGDEFKPGAIKRLVRELIHLTRPTSVTVKVRADQTQWREVFEDLAGFEFTGQEYSRPHWRLIYVWTPEAERRATRRAQPRPAAGRERRRPR